MRDASRRRQPVKLIYLIWVIIFLMKSLLPASREKRLSQALHIIQTGSQVSTISS